ncbi:MAG: phosphohistidine phosphatase SixA [Deltaproteobacteria bacterium]|nr:phosphohistidine phosphatase SixA [Deltaproteobacteria bacterium]
MAIYLVQHGRNLPKDQDPEQGLSPRGIDDVKRIAGLARGYEVPVASIVHSGKKRALQTAEIFCEALNPPQGIKQMDGLKPLDDVAAVAGGLKPESGLMIVGHLPFMERLASFLINGDTNRPVFKFQNGGIVCLDQAPGGNGWVIKWTLTPEIN